MIPWWKSRTIQFGLATLLLWIVAFALLLSGFDVDTLVAKAVAATGAVTTVMTILGRITSAGAGINPSEVAPGVVSSTVESIIAGIKDAREARDERIIE